MRACMHCGCGGEASIFEDEHGEWYVCCRDEHCDSCGPFRGTKEEAIRAWDRQNQKPRTIYPTDGLVEMVEENRRLEEELRRTELVGEVNRQTIRDRNGDIGHQAASIDTLQWENAELRAQAKDLERKPKELPTPDFTAYVVKSCGVLLATPNAFMHDAGDCPMLVATRDRGKAIARSRPGAVVRRVEIRYVEEVE